MKLFGCAALQNQCVHLSGGQTCPRWYECYFPRTQTFAVYVSGRFNLHLIVWSIKELKDISVRRLQSPDCYVIRVTDWKIAACVILLMLTAHVCILGKRPHLSLAAEWQCCDRKHVFNSLLRKIYQEEREKEDQTRMERNLTAVKRKNSQPAAVWR